MYYADIFTKSKHNMKRTWQNINDILHKGHSHSSYPDEFINENTKISDPDTIANAFNDFFVNLGPSLASKIPRISCPKEFMPGYMSSSFFISPISEDELVNVSLECLNPNKAAGYDGFRPQVVRKVISYISEPLTYVFNLSLNVGIFPEKLKIAKVVPIYKKGDQNQFVNYRPVSVLSCFSKILERLMFNRVQTFLTKHNVLTNSQYGFRPGHSTELALIEAVEKLRSSIDNNNTCIGVFLDLSKAFDTIDHGILLQKLERYGIRGICLNWFKSYLSDRLQFTSFNNVESNFQTVRCGVPQGSILGPLLFIIYMNDITMISKKAEVVLFADDTNIFFTGNDPYELESSVVNELSLFSDWFMANKLSLNISKTNFMVFNNSRHHVFNISINGQKLDPSKSVKFLGVIIDNKLTWQEHINNISSKIARGIGVIGRLRHLLPKRILRTIYLTLVYPHLMYCSTVWSCTKTSYLHNLVLLQKRVVRYISLSGPRDHTSELYKSLNLLKLFDMINLNIASFTYRFMHNLLPKSFSEFFTKNSLVHNYFTRQSHLLHSIATRTSSSQLTLSYKAIKLWNSLPDSLINRPSINSFRRGFSQYYIALY